MHIPAVAFMPILDVAFMHILDVAFMHALDGGHILMICFIIWLKPWTPPSPPPSPLMGAVLCMGGYPHKKVVLKVPIRWSTPWTIFPVQPHRPWAPGPFFQVNIVLR